MWFGAIKGMCTMVRALLEVFFKLGLVQLFARSLDTPFQDNRSILPFAKLRSIAA